jgi:LPXTG-motif cell wall-anchored protein
MSFDDIDANMDLDEAPPPEGKSNRPFLIVAGLLGAFMLIALACIAVYAWYYVPQQNAARERQIADVNAQNTQVAESIIQTSIAEMYTKTPTVTATQPPATSTPTNTPVVVIPASTQAPTEDIRTATVAALLTQAAALQQDTAPSPTATGLPSTGFADEVGIPGLIGLAVLLLVVVLIARRFRISA